MFKKNIETKGHGSIRKTKAYGAVAVLSLFGAMAAANGQTVSANEIPTEGENITSEASDTSLAVQAAAVEAPVTEVATEPVDKEPAVENTVAETPVVEAAPVAVETVAEAVVAEPVAEEPVEEVVSETVAEGTEVVTNADTTVTVETNELSTAITEAQAAGVKVRQGETVNLGTATTEQEAAALQAEAESKQAKQAQDIQDKTAKYLEDVAEAQKNTTKNGYLSEVTAQTLLFKSEPNATISSFATTGTTFTDGVTGKDSMSHAVSYDLGSSPVHFKDRINENGYGAKVSVGDTVTVEYTGLQNSSSNGTKISSVIYKYTLKESTLGFAYMVPVKDPTVTLWYYDLAGGVKWGVDVTYKDANGDEIPTDGLVSFSTLNATLDPTTKHRTEEYVQNFSGEMILITGSSIVDNSGKWMSVGDNSNAAYGAKYDESIWDVEGSPYEYYGAVAGKASGHITFETGSVDRGYVWFAFNTDVKAAELITKPTAEYNLYSYDVAIPDPVGDVVVRYQSTDGVTIKEQVTDTPESVVG
ncbi:GbpC/Spa domain-containing protein, partial [Streptococcus suis]